MSCIEANRKLKDVDEALLTAQTVGDIVAFLQHSSAGDRESLLSTDTMCEVLRPGANIRGYPPNGTQGRGVFYS